MKTTISVPSKSADTVPDLSVCPKHYELDQSVVVKGLGTLQLRPIRLNDEAGMIVFHRNISEESILLC
jgi:hypothetical protein